VIAPGVFLELRTTFRWIVLKKITECLYISANDMRWELKTTFRWIVKPVNSTYPCWTIPMAVLFEGMVI
jgi:hypothetical protein